jgi:subtilisin family serine protease
MPGRQLVVRRRARRAGPLLTAVAVAALALGGPAAAHTDDVANAAGLQWTLERIGAEESWATATGAGTIIAVVDSGVALGHEDLAGKLVPGVACQGTGGDPDRCSGSPADDDGHGTHVAGIAAAATGNGLGIAGVAPDARIMPVKVLFRACETCQSTGEPEDVAAAVRWAAEHGADVINLSLGSTTSAVFGPGFADAVSDAWELGAIAVVAAGNDYVLTADLDDARAVVVSSTDRDDAAPGYSNGVGDARWALAAPGGDGSDTPESCSQQGEPRGVLSTFWSAIDPAGGYACLSGTSMAAPHVSGALAILRSAGMDPAVAVQRVLDTAVDLGEPGPDQLFGDGRLDLAAAVAGAAVPAASPTSGPPITAVAGAQLPATAAPPGRPPDDTDGDDVPVGVALFAAALIALTGAGAVAVASRR